MGYMFDSLEEFETMFSFSGLMSMLSAIPGMLFSLAVYIVTAIAIYGIAKRRGINKPWLAFIPVANVWTLGCIADQYRYVVHGQVKSRRKVLLGLSIAMYAVSAVVLILCGAVMVKFLVQLPYLDTMTQEQGMLLVTQMLGPMMGALALCLPMLVLSIVYLVFYYIALNDLYKSCEPDNATLYLVLSILIGICQPVFLMVCYKKDGGMTPPPMQPQQPYGNNQPTWQPVQPAADPWEKKE